VSELSSALERGLYVVPEPFQGSEYFENSLDEAAKLCNPSDWARVGQVRALCRSGIAARRRASQMALPKYFREALLQSNNIQCEVSKALARTFTESALAMCDAWNGRYQAAEQRLRLSYIIDDQLIKEAGCDVIRYHQLQTLHNRERLVRMRGEADRSAVGIGYLIQGVWRGEIHFAENGLWPSLKIGSLDDTTQLDIFAGQLLADIARALFERLDSSSRLLELLKTHNSFANLPKLENSFIAFYDSLLFRHLFDIELASEALASGRPDGPRCVMWDLIALEAISYTIRASPHHSSQLRDSLSTVISMRGGTASWLHSKLQRQRVESYGS
jgi:hypothetical protein